MPPPPPPPPPPQVAKAGVKAKSVTRSSDRRRVTGDFMARDCNKAPGHNPALLNQVRPQRGGASSLDVERRRPFSLRSCLKLLLFLLLLQLALALFAQLAAFALAFGVLRALRDRLARGALDALHLGL